MQETSGRTDFMKTVEEIKLAEDESEKIVHDAKEKADRILRKAKEEVFKEKAKMEDEIVTFKNERLQEGGSEIEGEVKKILKKADAEAEKIRKMKLDKKETDSIVSGFLKDA